MENKKEKNILKELSDEQLIIVYAGIASQTIKILLELIKKLVEEGKYELINSIDDNIVNLMMCDVAREFVSEGKEIIEEVEKGIKEKLKEFKK